MTLEQVFWASQIVAAAGVIASLIFVGLEVRKNARAVRAGTEQAIEEHWASMYVSLQDNPTALANIFKGLVDYGGLTPLEKGQFVCSLMAIMSYYQNAFDQWRDRHLRADLWGLWELRMMYLLQSPGGTAFWRERSYLFTKEFQAEVDLAMSRPQHPLAKAFGVVPLGHSTPTAGTPTRPT